jgi:raffinose/stachyose/melibiose transport system substrate-binding protein
MSTKNRIRSGTLAASALLALSLSACAPGGSAPAESSSTPVSDDISGAGKVTLQVWDQNTDEGINEAQDALNDAFTKKYPNVTIDRQVQSFSDLKTTLRLALSGDNPPDVIQANQGYPDMGAFVQGGLLRSLNDYDKLYDWSSYYPESLLKINSFSSDGKDWQGDNLYGISQAGEVVGVFYNKDVLAKLGVEAPTSLEELEADMAAAKAAGVLPMAYGDVEKSGGIHLYGVVQAALAGADAVNDLATGKSGAWTDDTSVQAAEVVQSWAEKGYLTEGANGIARDEAFKTFESGGAAFAVSGSWYQAQFTASMGTSAGFTTLIPKGEKTPATTGGESLAWAITTGSKNPDVAAAYIDFINVDNAAQVFLDQNSLPSVLPEGYEPESGTLTADIVNAYRSVSESGGMVPYLDYSTPTFYDTLSGAVQQLTDGQVTPEAFAKILQDDYSAFLEKKK